jgi:hypothetical protein
MTAPRAAVASKVDILFVLGVTLLPCRGLRGSNDQRGTKQGWSGLLVGTLLTLSGIGLYVLLEKGYAATRCAAARSTGWY